MNQLIENISGNFDNIVTNSSEIENAENNTNEKAFYSDIDPSMQNNENGN